MLYEVITHEENHKLGVIKSGKTDQGFFLAGEMSVGESSATPSYNFV